MGHVWFVLQCLVLLLELRLQWQLVLCQYANVKFHKPLEFLIIALLHTVFIVLAQ